MSLVKNMDNWSDMSKLDLLYKFSIIKYLRYFIIPELFGLNMRFFNALNLLLAAKFLSQTPFFKFLPNHFSVSLFFLPDQ